MLNITKKVLILPRLTSLLRSQMINRKMLMWMMEEDRYFYKQFWYAEFLRGLLFYLLNWLNNISHSVTCKTMRATHRLSQYNRILKVLSVVLTFSFATFHPRHCTEWVPTLTMGKPWKHKLVKDVLLTDEDTYRINFINYLFGPVCEYVGSLLYSEIEVQNKNTVGQTGVQTRVPHTTNDLFYSHPDI